MSLAPNQVSRPLAPLADCDERPAGPHLHDGGALTLSDVIEVPLTKGYVAVVDAADAWVLQWKWYAAAGNGKVYARRNIRSGGKRGSMLLHHAILGERRDGLVADHMDGNSLNNRRENLRWVSFYENNRNVSGALVTNRSSGVRGVTWCEVANNWRARIHRDGKSICIGHFATVKEAAAARAEAEIRMWGIQPCREADLLRSLEMEGAAS